MCPDRAVAPFRCGKRARLAQRGGYRDTKQRFARKISGGPVFDLTRKCDDKPNPDLPSAFEMADCHRAWRRSINSSFGSSNRVSREPAMTEPMASDSTIFPIEQGIGNPILDNSTLSAFRRWRFRPGSPPRVRIPTTFLLTGAQY